MPELPDIETYLEALEPRILGKQLQCVRLASPFLLRSVAPPLSDADGCEIVEVRRIGKRIGIGLAGDLWLVIHLMIAGRFQWKEPGAKIPRKLGLASFDFDHGCLFLTEAGTKKRASLHVVKGEDGLRAHDPGGAEPLGIGLAEFTQIITARNHTLKRALTDPHYFSGIGNAYSDEILHRAGLSPIKWTERLTDDEIARLFDATRTTLIEWTDRLRDELKGNFPKKVTAFRPEMAVHGKYGEPCPICASAVQRIRYASNETNYCAVCQTDGKVLADRGLSRLLGKDWPRSLEELEQLRSSE